MKTMVLVIDELEYEAIDNAVKFVLETEVEESNQNHPDAELYSQLMESTERVLNKLMMLKKVYN